MDRQTETANERKEFALSFLVKELLITKVLFLTETARNQCFDTAGRPEAALGHGPIREVAGCA